MRTVRQLGGERSDLARSFAALAVSFSLAVGCQASTPSTAPATSSASAPTQPSLTPSAPSTAEPTGTPSAGGRWEAAGTMALSRRVVNAVLLGDGGVLVAGDGAYDITDNSAKAELWDPATGTWRGTEGLNSPRADFAAVPLADGRALVTGGRNQSDQSFSSTYVFGPLPATWAKVGLLETARTSPITAVLRDGRVLVAGGYFRTKPDFGSNAAPDAMLASYRSPAGDAGSFGPRLADIEPPNVGYALATAEIFDPATGNWSPTGALNFARFGGAAVTLTDGRILVVGSPGADSGVTLDDRAADSTEIYDPTTGRFSLTGRLPEIDRSALEKMGVPGANPVPDDDPRPAENGTLVALNDGGAVLIAHAGWWKHVGDITRSFRFDAGTGAWTEIGQTYVFVGEPTAVSLVTPDVPRLAGAMVAKLTDGRILVAGGAGPAALPYSNTPTTASAQLYDPAANTWSPLPPMPEVRAGGATVVLTDGSVLLIGGYIDTLESSIVLSSAIRFVPSP